MQASKLPGARVLSRSTSLALRECSPGFLPFIYKHPVLHGIVLMHARPRTRRNLKRSPKFAHPRALVRSSPRLKTDGLDRRRLLFLLAVFPLETGPHPESRVL